MSRGRSAGTAVASEMYLRLAEGPDDLLREQRSLTRRLCALLLIAVMLGAGLLLASTAVPDNPLWKPEVAFAAGDDDHDDHDDDDSKDSKDDSKDSEDESKDSKDTKDTKDDTKDTKDDTKHDDTKDDTKHDDTKDDTKDTKDDDSKDSTDSKDDSHH